MSGWGLPYFRSDEPVPLTIIPVEMVTIADVTRLKRQQVKPPKKTKKKPPRKKRVEEKMPPAPPKMASSMPLADVKPKPEKTAKQIAARSPRITPRRKPPVPGKFTSSKIFALLDKHPEEEKSLEDQLKEKGYDQVAQLSDIDQKMQTMNYAAIVKKQIEDDNCWNIQGGGRDVSSMSALVVIRLNPDGSLNGVPEAVDKNRMNRSGQEFFKAFVESAIRAVRICAPFKLPREKYEQWREFTFRFTPK